MAPSTERIVVGTDGSPSSDEAVRWALAEARLRGSELEVVHAWEFPGVGVAPYGDVSLPVITRDELEKVAEAVVRRTVRDVIGAEAGPPVATSTVVRAGKASEVLLAEAKGAAMVVVGARGRGKFASLMLGSVSSKVVRHAPVPVVVIPSPSATS